MALDRTSPSDLWWRSHVPSPTSRPRRIRYTITNTRTRQHKIHRTERDGSTHSQRRSILLHPLSRPIFHETSQEDAFRTALLYQTPFPSSSASSPPPPAHPGGPVHPMTPPSSPPLDSEGRNISVRIPSLSPFQESSFFPETPDSHYHHHHHHQLPDDTRRAYKFRITQLERDLRAATAWGELLRRQREEVLEELAEVGYGEVMVLPAQTFAGESYCYGDGSEDEDKDESEDDEESEKREVKEGRWGILQGVAAAGVGRASKLESGVRLGFDWVRWVQVE